MKELDELRGRLIALEALVEEMAIRLPRPDSDRLLNSVEPGLQRQMPPLRQWTTMLIGRIRHRMPMA